MTPMLARDEIQNLPQEQQEAFARLLLQRAESRQQLLKRARLGRGTNVLGGLLMGLGGGLAILSTSMPRALPFAIIAVTALVAFHAAALNRRIDALMDLLETDIKRASEVMNTDDHGMHN